MRETRSLLFMLYTQTRGSPLKITQPRRSSIGQPNISNYKCSGGTIFFLEGSAFSGFPTSKRLVQFLQW